MMRTEEEPIVVRKLNQVIEYIEQHLESEVSLGMIAEYAGVSDFHFRTLFRYLSGMTLSEYIKNRRLSEAGNQLLAGKSVTEVAYTYGYQSVDGFTRAFKAFSGILPSEVSKTGLGTTCPKLSFTISVKGGNTMEFKIVEKPAFNFVGVSKRVPMQFKGVNLEIIKLAQSITERQREEMHRLQDIEPKEIVNASYEAEASFLREEGALTHLIGVLTTSFDAGERLETVSVQAGTWAVFPNEGPFPATLQQTMANVYAQWLPSSNFELVEAPTFSFTNMDSDREGYAYSEVWIPVKRMS